MLSIKEKFFPSSTEAGRVENSVVKGSQIDFVCHQWVSKSMSKRSISVPQCIHNVAAFMFYRQMN